MLLFFLMASFPGQAQNNDSCIVSMKIFTYTVTDSSNCRIEKRAVPDFIKHIKDCNNNFEYSTDYKDRGFIIQIPRYLKHRYYTFGGHEFWINFYDTTSEDQSTIRSVNIYYDFDSSYKEFVFKEIAAGKRKEIIDPASGRKIYPFVNYNDKYAANIFIENNIVVLYYTKEKQFEEELRRSILSFKLKEP
jgi:hypothetical protein